MAVLRELNHALDCLDSRLHSLQKHRNVTGIENVPGHIRKRQTANELPRVY